MNSFTSGVSNFLWNILNRPGVKDLLDILLVAYIIYKLLMLTSGTRASQVLKGFILLIIASWLSGAFGLTAVNWIMMSVLNNGAIVLMILFQPEIRRALEHIGRGAKLDRTQSTQDDGQRIVSEITQSMLSLSRRRIGALVVFERRTGLKDFIDTGISIDSVVSGPLLINIFEPNTPLHDGAVIIRDSRIVAAACVLTLSDSSNLSRDLGTRHRAGLGVTESTDAMVIIVSEETGIISMAQGGKLTRHLDAEGLNRFLTDMYQDSSTPSLLGIWNSVKGWVQSRKAKDEQ